MGAECCEGNMRFGGSEEIQKCKAMYELRKLLEIKYKDAVQEQKEINLYLKDKKFIPTSVEIDDFNEEEIKKRIPYLDEMKKCLRTTNELLKAYPNANLRETKRRILELYLMYSWIYDDEKRYSAWMMSFKYFIENDG